MDDEPPNTSPHPFVAYLTANVTLSLTRADALFLVRDYLTPNKRSFDGSRETIRGARQRIEAGLARAADTLPNTPIHLQLPRVVAEELALALSQAFASSHADTHEPASATLYCVLPEQLDDAHRLGEIIDRQLFGDVVSSRPMIKAAQELAERDLVADLPSATEKGQ